MESEFNRLANELIGNGRLAEARTVLEAAIRDMPAGWKPSRKDEQQIEIAFWDEEEFLAYLDYHGASLTEMMAWTSESYSKAWYQLAVLAIEQGRLENALLCLNCGLRLESDHPELWSEKGYVLARLKRPQEALECYARAASARDWAPATHLARALRGQGVALVELDRLDEAEAILNRSLEFEACESARREISYVQSLRAKRLPSEFC